MKFVVAVIKPFKLHDVRRALSGIGLQGLTISEVSGFGREKGYVEHYRGAEYGVDLLPKIKIEAALDDDRVEQAIKAICQAACTGKVGDGKIFVLPLEQVVRIRTAETAEVAL
ncbi:MAG: P-II family nitrogen regulator [Nitrococcus mobilis]|nr:P-II family nitrogen regulator [Nitrococcus mobilis]